MEDRQLVSLQTREMALIPQESGYGEDEASKRSPMNPLAIVLRRWRLVVLMAILACALAMPPIWLLIEPKYTAVSAIEIAPVVPWIVFEDHSPMPHYTTYVNTQAALITSTRVLHNILDDPAVRQRGFFRDHVNPMAYLQDSLRARADRNSQLLLVSMTDTDPRMASEVANAAVRVYMGMEGGSEATTEDQKLRALEAELDSTAQRLQTLYDTAYEMGQEFGTTDLSGQERILLERVQALQSALTDVETAAIVTRAQIAKLQESAAPSIMPSEMVKLRSEYVAADPTVATYTQTVTRLQQDFALTHVRFLDGSSEIEQRSQALEAMKKELTAATERAEERFDRIMEQEFRIEQARTIEDLKSTLTSLELRKNRIDELLSEQNERVITLGRKSLDIQRLEHEIGLTSDLYQTVRQRLQVLRVERQRPARMRVAFPAEVPSSPTEDKRKQYSAVVLLGSLVFGAGMAVFLHTMDMRIEKPSDVESVLHLPLLGTMPRFEDLDKRRIKPRHFIDDCRAIRVNLMLSGHKGSGRVIVIASPQGRDGKTTLAINLATSTALTGKRVLLVDGDLRKPEVARYLRLDNTTGLNDLLAGECKVSEAVKPTKIETLFILPSNRTSRNQKDPLDSTRLRELVAEMRNSFDEIIIDTPAVLAMPDAKIWASLADGVMLVARSAKTGAKDLEEAKLRFELANTKILGVVLTGVHIDDSYEKYSHRYTRGYVDEPLTTGEEVAARVFLLCRSEEDDDGESPDGSVSV